MIRTARHAARILISLALLAGFSHLASAQSVQRIAAIVNDEVISTYDLEQRVRMVISASNREATPEMVSRIQPQVLRGLIDEKLQMQEAERRGAQVTAEEVDRGVAQIAQRNNIGVEQLYNRFDEFGVSPETFKDQIRAEIAWSKLVRARFAPRITVSQDEVQAVYRRIAAQSGGEQYRVSEIFLAIEQPGRAAEVRQNAERLIEQLRSGASFAAIASQFSESTSAANGGDIGWVTPGQLDPALDRALAGLQPGMIAGPIETEAGIYIIGLADRRAAQGVNGQTRLTLSQIVVAVTPQADASEVAAAQARAGEARARMESCEAVEDIRTDYAPLSGALGALTPSDLPPAFRNAVAALDTGETTAPIRTENGFHVLILCDRQENAPDPRLMERIETQLRDQQLTMLARRYLRDLRRDATIVVR
ncbi:MAG: peptidylprolyl isomerase [Alphaproteobacteria bacterium]|nr:peptidylprolyl isomerase [Alphaproteobacteria bacterium]MDX5368405.1 peptidylprolyl isomerase [Alphaproteobacteria bacterium]MDX5463200.1 peptidylprolyl isomerase [Alphaproteobacteria bacterium]